MIGNINSIINKLIFISVFLISGCSSFFSGSTNNPVLDDDRNIIKNASNNLNEVPSLKHDYGNKRAFIIPVMFDGTENDKNNVKDNERETVVALLYEKISENNKNAIYLNGPGVSSKLDAAFCGSCIQKAYEAMGKIENIVKSNGDGYDYRVVVIGFSRGAAIGRHFMNLISDKWGDSGGDISVRSYAILFDTVATGQVDKLRLGISATTDYIVHVIARDERRNLFNVVTDNDNYFPIYKGENFRKSLRLLELNIPGVHSDIGGSYSNGLASVYRVLAEEILSEMDILSINNWSVESGFLDYGAHDSRGTFDKLFLSKSYAEYPNLIRSKTVVDSEEMRIDQELEIPARLKEYFNKKYSVGVLRSKVKNYGGNLETAKFTVINNDEQLKFVSKSSWINQETVDFDVEKKQLLYHGYEFNGFVPKSNLILVDSVFNEIIKYKISDLEIVVSSTNIENEKIINFYVNKKIIYKLNSNN